MINFLMQQIGLEEFWMNVCEQKDDPHIFLIWLELYCMGAKIQMSVISNILKEEGLI